MIRRVIRYQQIDSGTCVYTHAALLSCGHVVEFNGDPLVDVLFMVLILKQPPVLVLPCEECKRALGTVAHYG